MWIVLIPSGAPKRAHHTHFSLVALYGSFGNEINFFNCLKFYLKIYTIVHVYQKLDVNHAPCNVGEKLAKKN